MCVCKCEDGQAWGSNKKSEGGARGGGGRSQSSMQRCPCVGLTHKKIRVCPSLSLFPTLPPSLPPSLPLNQRKAWAPVTPTLGAGSGKTTRRLPAPHGGGVLPWLTTDNNSPQPTESAAPRFPSLQHAGCVLPERAAGALGNCRLQPARRADTPRTRRGPAQDAPGRLNADSDFKLIAGSCPRHGMAGSKQAAEGAVQESPSTTRPAPPAFKPRGPGRPGLR